MAVTQMPGMELWGAPTFRDFGYGMLGVVRDDGAEAPRRRVVEFCAKRWEVPIVCLTVYLVMVWTSRKRPPMKGGPAIDAGFAAWNLALALFSWWGVFQMLPWMYDLVATRGFTYTVCGELLAFPGSDRQAMLALLLFCFSKIPEFGDTAFLILRGKPVRLLQWYHHSTVMIFCWLAVATAYTPGAWFALMNYSVHAVMYMYFFLTYFDTLKSFVKRVGPLITIFQISQMGLGLMLNAIAIYHYVVGNECFIQNITVHAAVVMYGSYFVLFSQLFSEGRRGKSAGKGGKKPQKGDKSVAGSAPPEEVAKKVE